jgi:hypothetical protein
MANPSKLRRQIAYQAAVLMYQRQESEYYRAKMKAAKAICKGWVKPKDLPSNAEIRDEIQNFARMFEGESRTKHLQDMRVEALRLMLILEKYHPRLIGSVLTGHVRAGSDIDLHLFSNSVEAVTVELDYNGIVYDTEVKRVVKAGERNVYKHVHIQDRYPIELTIYPLEKRNFGFKSSITGKVIERASIKELVNFLQTEYSQLNIDHALSAANETVDRFQVYYSLLLPLENVKQNPDYHPEGDALYHSLQVFDLACDRQPYDEEFLLAALLHDVGKGIDRYDHVGSGLEALQGLITERTCWLIEHHMDAHRLHDRTAGARLRKRLRAHPDYHDLVALNDCDRAGRVSGVQTTSLEDALDYIREISEQYA